MKTCCNCNIEKPLEDFNNWLKSKDGKQPRCRDCQRQYQKELYQRSPARRKQIREVDKRLREKNKQVIVDLKSVSPCNDCGNYYPYYVMDFDHVDDSKLHNIADMVSKGRSLERIQEEISKCEIVCANCHRIRTHLRLGGRLGRH